MTWFDYAVLAVLGVSMLWSLLHGFVRELVSMTGWIAAFVLSMAFSPTLARMLPESLGPLLAGLLAFLAIFIGVWLLSGLVGLILSRAARAAGLGWTDRLLGALFGLVRGLVIVLVAVMLVGLTPLPREPFWRNAVLAGPLETAVVLVKRALPEGLAERMRFGRQGAA
jgi:membrane protein required for colicin V production